MGTARRAPPIVQVGGERACPAGRARRPRQNACSPVPEPEPLAHQFQASSRLGESLLPRRAERLDARCRGSRAGDRRQPARVAVAPCRTSAREAELGRAHRCHSPSREAPGAARVLTRSARVEEGSARARRRPVRRSLRVRPCRRWADLAMGTASGIRAHGCKSRPYRRQCLRGSTRPAMARRSWCRELSDHPSCRSTARVIVLTHAAIASASANSAGRRTDPSRHAGPAHRHMPQRTVARVVDPVDPPASGSAPRPEADGKGGDPEPSQRLTRLGCS